MSWRGGWQLTCQSRVLKQTSSSHVYTDLCKKWKGTSKGLGPAWRLISLPLHKARMFIPALLKAFQWWVSNLQRKEAMFLVHTLIASNILNYLHFNSSLLLHPNAHLKRNSIFLQALKNILPISPLSSPQISLLVSKLDYLPSIKRVAVTGIKLTIVINTCLTLQNLQGFLQQFLLFKEGCINFFFFFREDTFFTFAYRAWNLISSHPSLEMLAIWNIWKFVGRRKDGSWVKWGMLVFPLQFSH